MNTISYVIIFITLFLIIWGLLYVINYSYNPIISGCGVIVSKEFIPDYINNTTMTYNVKEWVLYIKVDNKICSYSVNEKYYNNSTEGQTIKIKYSIGRLWNNLYILKIEN
jgi:hypothetical protein